MTETFQLHLADNHYHPYTLVKSARAKYVRIKISPLGELSVVLPRGIAEKKAHRFLQQKAQWVAKTINQIPILEKTTFPKQLDLKLLNEVWDIEYLYVQNDESIQLQEISEGQLRLKGNVKNWDAVKKTLNHWCKKKATPLFHSMLEKIAEEHGFHFNRLSVRSQKTRWGSCSHSKNINLNSKLLFMPKNIVEYVMIHELCHTLEMNHSSNFWKLVEDCDPEFKQNRNTLKQHGKAVVL